MVTADVEEKRERRVQGAEWRYDYTPTRRSDMTAAALDLADRYPNVFLEASAMFATLEDGLTFKYPGQGLPFKPTLTPI